MAAHGRPLSSQILDRGRRLAVFVTVLRHGNLARSVLQVLSDVRVGGRRTCYCTIRFHCNFPDGSPTPLFPKST